MALKPAEQQKISKCRWSTNTGQETVNTPSNTGQETLDIPTNTGQETPRRERVWWLRVSAVDWSASTLKTL